MRVIEELRTEPDKLAHAKAQLGLAAGLRSLGRAASLEPELRGGKKADLAWVAADGELTVAEIKLMGSSQPFRTINADWEAQTRVLRGIATSTQTDLRVRIAEPLSPAEARRLYRVVREAALRVRVRHRPERVAVGRAQVVVRPEPSPVVSGSGPPAPIESGRRLRRVVKKAIFGQLALAPRAVLVVDVQDGLWQFTEFAAQPLHRKVEMIAGLVGPLLDDASHVRALAVTTGAIADPADAPSEESDDVWGIGIRSRLGCGMVRESIVLPGQGPGDDFATLAEHFASEGDRTELQLVDLGWEPLRNCFAR